jgi:hypothetical protein
VQPSTRLEILSFSVCSKGLEASYATTIIELCMVSRLHPGHLTAVGELTLLTIRKRCLERTSTLKPSTSLNSRGLFSVTVSAEFDSIGGDSDDVGDSTTHTPFYVIH